MEPNERNGQLPRQARDKCKKETAVETRERACVRVCFVLLTNQFDVGRFDPIGDSTSNPWTHIGANSCIQLTRKEKKPHCHPPRFLFSADVCLDRLRTDTPQAVTETSGVAHRPGGDELNGRENGHF